MIRRKKLTKKHIKPQINSKPKKLISKKVKAVITASHKITNKEKMNKPPLINIVTRTSGRPNGFKRCHNSILSQTYSNIKHIVSIDDYTDKEYVDKYNVEWYFIDKNAISKKPDILDPKTGKRFIFNLYFNELFDKIKSGWIMILDDDDWLAHPQVIENAVKSIQNDTDMILWQMQYPNGSKLPTLQELGKTPKLGRIGSPCFMVHSSIAKNVKFDGWKCGDFRYISKIYKLTNQKRLLKQTCVMLNSSGGFGLKKDIAAPRVIKKEPLINQPKIIIPNDNKIGFVDYVIIISSYSRPKSIKSLLTQIKSEADLTNISYQVILLDDHSPQIDTYIEASKIIPNTIYIRNSENNGKKKYWRSINSLLAIAKDINFRWLLQFDDDFDLTSNFFNKLDNYINSQRGNFAIKLHLDDSSSKVRWRMKHWVDGGAAYPYVFLNKINYKVPKIPLKRWSRDESLSSGVWETVSRRLNQHKYKVYIPPESLTYHRGYNDSRMNSKLRKKIKIETKKFKK